MSAPNDVTKAHRAIASLLLAIVLVAVTTIGIRASYGFFNNEMHVALILPRAGQALHLEAFVEYRGVEVGKVHSIELIHSAPDHDLDNQVKVTVYLHRNAKVPAGVKATVEPLTFFGDKFIDLTATDGDHSPYLADGSTVTDTGVGDEVETLVAKVVPLLSGINVNDLTTVLTELQKTVQNGEGEKIAASFDSGVKMAALFRTTLDAQLNALAALNRFSNAIKDYGPVINAISSTLNQALPVFNQARQQFATLLATLGPFADNLASFLSVNRPDLDRILDEGGNIVRVVTAHQQDLADTIYGLSRYLYAFANGVSADVLPNGKRAAYFKIMVDLSNINDLICGVVANAPAQLAPLRTALFGQNGLVNCNNSFSTVPGANGVPQAKAAPRSAPAAPTTSTPGANTAQNLTDDLFGQLAQPNVTTGGSLSNLVNTLLGVGS